MSASVVRFTLLQAALSTVTLARRSARRWRWRSPAARIPRAQPLHRGAQPRQRAAGDRRRLRHRRRARPRRLGRARRLRLLGIDLGGWLYGLPGILIAHVFFNAPLAARVFLASLAAVPGEHWRLAAQLGMGPAAIFRFIDCAGAASARRPMHRGAHLPALLHELRRSCSRSAAGRAQRRSRSRSTKPCASTSISPAPACLRSCRWRSASWSRCRSCGSRGAPARARRIGAMLSRPDADEPSAMQALDAAVLVGWRAPCPAAARCGRRCPASRRWRALLRPTCSRRRRRASPSRSRPRSSRCSLALGARIVGCGALARCAAARDRRAALSLPGGLILAVPPVAVSAGLFVVLRPVADPFALAIPLIILVNALMALPFALTQVEPPLTLSAERYGRARRQPRHLAASGASGSSTGRCFDRPLAAAFAVADGALARRSRRRRLLRLGQHPDAAAAPLPAHGRLSHGGSRLGRAAPRVLVLGAVPRCAKMVGRAACSKPLTSTLDYPDFHAATR